MKRSPEEKAAHWAKEAFSSATPPRRSTPRGVAKTKQESNIAHRDEIKTFVDYIDADEKKDLNKRPSPSMAMIMSMRTIFYSVWRFMAVLLLAGLAGGARGQIDRWGIRCRVFQHTINSGRNSSLSRPAFSSFGLRHAQQQGSHAKTGRFGTGWLQQHSAAYVMDIHSMPAIITRLFALPKMRKCPARIILCEDEKHWPHFPENRKGSPFFFLPATAN